MSVPGIINLLLQGISFVFHLPQLLGRSFKLACQELIDICQIELLSFKVLTQPSIFNEQDITTLLVPAKCSIGLSLQVRAPSAVMGKLCFWHLLKRVLRKLMVSSFSTNSFSWSAASPSLLVVTAAGFGGMLALSNLGTAPRYRLRSLAGCKPG